MEDTLAPSRVEPLLTGTFGRPYVYEDVCESTQRLLDPSLPEGAVAVCDRQTAGRGRLGRTWEAPAGSSILCSVLLRPPPEQRAVELSLMGGVAVAETVEDALELTTQVKWPNDVMVDRRKVAGVLAEARDSTVVLGIGLNVRQSRDELPRDARTEAASLYTISGFRLERAPLLAGLLARLEARYRDWCDGGLGALYDSLGARDFLRGRRVFLDGRPGIGVGVDRDGRFEIELPAGHVLVESGEIDYAR
jgi:BirA family biotin operon repressor/biotin-[acetyl-CoA-carboxylase] ligase